LSFAIVATQLATSSPTKPPHPRHPCPSAVKFLGPLILAIKERKEHREDRCQRTDDGCQMAALGARASCPQAGKDAFHRAPWNCRPSSPRAVCGERTEERGLSSSSGTRPPLSFAICHLPLWQSHRHLPSWQPTSSPKKNIRDHPWHPWLNSGVPIRVHPVPSCFRPPLFPPLPPVQAPRPSGPIRGGKRR
jgi:hypothetical protein